MTDRLSHRERHARLFQRIALPYSWFFAGQTRSYAACFEIARDALGDPTGKRALDLGCGTGLDAFLAALETGPQGKVWGLDMTDEMLEEASDADEWRQ